MKKNIIFSFLTMAIFLLNACCKIPQDENCSALSSKTAAAVVEPSMKGWELYSWPGTGCDGWNFCILPGTNKFKSYAAVTSDTCLYKVTGLAQLESLLDKFPSKESIAWMGQSWLEAIWGSVGLYTGNLKLPPASILQRIESRCRQRDLQLVVLP
ncbi:MAG: hypothetical protein U0V75_14410 [Ferruginibacter sp.]